MKEIFLSSTILSRSNCYFLLEFHVIALKKLQLEIYILLANISKLDFPLQSKSPPTVQNINFSCLLMLLLQWHKQLLDPGRSQTFILLNSNLMPSLQKKGCNPRWQIVQIFWNLRALHQALPSHFNSVICTIYSWYSLHLSLFVLSSDMSWMLFFSLFPEVSAFLLPLPFGWQL